MELNKLSLALLTASTIGLTACGGDSSSSGSNAIDLELTAPNAVTDVTLTSATEDELISLDGYKQLILNQRVSGSLTNISTLAQVMESKSTTTVNSQDVFTFTAAEAGTYMVYLTGSREDGSTPDGAEFTVVVNEGGRPLANGGFVLVYDLAAEQTIYITVRDMYYSGNQTTTNYELTVAEMSREVLGLADGEHLLQLNSNTSESCSGIDDGTPWEEGESTDTFEEFALLDLNNAMFYVSDYDFPEATISNASSAGFTAQWDGSTPYTESEGTYLYTETTDNVGNFAVEFNSDLSGGTFTGSDVENYDSTVTEDGTVTSEESSECDISYLSGTFSILL